jgi:hypothetical protein
MNTTMLLLGITLILWGLQILIFPGIPNLLIGVLALITGILVIWGNRGPVNRL